MLIWVEFLLLLKDIECEILLIVAVDGIAFKKIFDENIVEDYLKKQ